MFNRLHLLLFTLLSFVLVQTASSQTTVNRGLAEHSIVFGGFAQAGQVIHLNYEIPFAGVVTLQLLDGEGKRVWHKQAPLEPGPNHFSMKKSAFRPDESYSFVLQYKLSEVSGPVPAP